MFFTVETTVRPSFALPRDCCSGVSMSAEGWFHPRDTGLLSLDSFWQNHGQQNHFRERSGALPRDCCSGVSMSAGVLRFGSHRQPLQNPRGSAIRNLGDAIVLTKHIFQPRIARFFTNGNLLRRKLSLFVLFVIIREIRGSRTSGGGRAHRRVRSSMRLRRECFSRSRRPCSPPPRGSALRNSGAVDLENERK